MFKVRLITEVEEPDFATKTIEIPFPPFEGLELREKGADGAVADQYVIESVVWDVPCQSFECFVFFGLGKKVDMKFNTLLEKRGWAKMSGSDEVPNGVDEAARPSRCLTVFEQMTMDFLGGKSHPGSNVDPVEYLKFAAREAFLHIRSCDPSLPEDDVLAGNARNASFACDALLNALEQIGDVESRGWKNLP